MASLLISAALSTAVSLLFPPKAQEVGKLDNLHLQGSAYGAMIPIIYGAFRVPVNGGGAQVDFQDDLKEHSHSSGGKGGPKVTTFTYTCSWGVKLCKGPLQSIRRVWADSQLIYSTVDTEATGGDLPLTFYLGEETALPDPTYEIVVGVGNAPAYRDDAAIVFTDFDVTPYGNRLPNISAEVIQNAGSIPVRVSSFTPILDQEYGRVSGVSYDATTRVLTYGKYLGGTTSSDYTVDTYNVDGSNHQQTFAVNFDSLPDATHTFWRQCQNDYRIAFGFIFTNSLGDNDDVSGWYVSGVLAVHPVSGGPGSTHRFAVQTPPYITKLADDGITQYLYACGGSGSPSVNRYTCINGVPGVGPGKSYSFSTDAGQNYYVTVDEADGGVVYACRFDNINNGGELFKFDADLNLLHHWTYADTPPEFDGVYAPTVYRGLLCQDQPALVGDKTIRVWKINADNTFTLQGAIVGSNGPVVHLGNGLCAVTDGIISLNPLAAPITLASIVNDISDRCSQPARDTSALTDLVDGYGIVQQTDGRGAISPLQLAWHFDPVESSTSVKFVKRGGSSAVTIPADDLAAHASGSQEPPIKTYVRKQEEELPQFLDVTYINGAAAYETGNQSAQRQTVRTQNRMSLQLSISMSDTKGKQVADVNLATPWMERDAFTINVPRKYTYIEPTDVITADGAMMRVINKDELANGVIKIDGVRTHPSIWITAPVAGSGGGFVPTLPPTVSSSIAHALFLDIPLIADDDSGPGFYVASDTPAGLFKSVDGGITFTQVASLSASTMGSATTALGDWTDGDTFDESNSVTVTLTNGTLSSTTEDAVLNGANEAVLGNEIIQFKTATLISANTYTLSGLLRGRRGTEFTTGSHVAGDRFVLLPVTNVPGAVSEINQARVYKVVPATATVASASPVTFTNTGIGLRPYSPVLVGGGPNTSGDVLINWTRRTRGGGSWLPFVDASLGELTESYVVQIWDSTYTNCARVISGLTSPTCTYTSAQQVTDFGSQQQTIYATVGQLGQVGLGIQAHAAIPGAGGSNTSVISPVQPFGFTPTVTTGCTLPTQNNTVTWASPTTQTYLGFSPGTEWVIKFTTPSSFGGTTQMTLTGAEYPVDGSQPTNRVAVLSTSPCGSPLSPACSVSSDTITIPTFTPGHNPIPTYYPTLQPSTDYYLSITTDATSTMFVNLVHN